MRHSVRPLRSLLPGLLGLLLAVPALAAPPQRNESVCLAAPTGGGSFNTFILQDVAPLAPGKAIPLHGMYFNGTRRAIPLSGSAVMSFDGTVRVGAFVHSSATSTSTFGSNDFTFAGTTDETLAGTYYFDSDGDFVPNGTLSMAVVDCRTIVLP